MLIQSLPIKIPSQNLNLRPLELRDAPLFFEYMKDKSNFLHVDIPIYTDISQAETYIQEKNQEMQDEKWFIWAIADKKTDLILGTICFWNLIPQKNQAEVGYWLIPGNQGKGIMTEALKTVVQFGFKVLGLETIEAYTARENTKSIALLRRVNFQLKDFYRKDSKIYMIYQYSRILADLLAIY